MASATEKLNQTSAASGIQAAVAALTRPSRQAVTRDDGSTGWAITPSLWDLSSTVLYSHGEGGSHEGAPARERSPLDLDLLEVRALIRETTQHEMQSRKLPRRASVPLELRDLAGHVLAYQAELWWWEYRFASWARLLTAYLRLGDRTPTAVWLRNSTCPACGTRQVIIDTKDGPRVFPALVIDFHNGLVRAARCCSCGADWGRGEQLTRLADSLR